MKILEFIENSETTNKRIKILIINLRERRTNNWKNELN